MHATYVSASSPATAHSDTVLPQTHRTIATAFYQRKMELFRHRFGFLHHTAVPQRPWLVTACRPSLMPSPARGICMDLILCPVGVPRVMARWHDQYAFAPATACPVEAYDYVTQRKLTNAGLRTGSTDRLHRVVWLISSSTLLALGVHATRICTDEQRQQQYVCTLSTCSLWCSPSLSPHLSLSSSPAKKGSPAYRSY